MSKALFNMTFTCPNPPAKFTGKARADYIGERKFYNGTAVYNYFAYSENGEKIGETVVKPYSYFDYTPRGEESGSFNFDGPLTESELDALHKRWGKTESIIWHGFISFDEETSKGFTTQENAQKFMRQSFKSIFKNSHLDADNIDLKAELHKDKEHHYHIHFAFVEKEPKYLDKYGRLSYSQKGSFKPTVIDNYLISANMHLEENKDEYYTARDRAMEKLRAIKLSAAKAKEQVDLKRNLSILAAKLPATGRLQYDSSNMEKHRKEVDTIANLLIRSNPEALAAHIEMQKQFALKEQQVIKLIKDNKLAYKGGKRLSARDVKAITDDGKKEMSDEYVDLRRINYVKKLRAEYASRVGNHILGLCRRINYEPRQQRRARVNDKQYKINSRRKRKRFNNVLYAAIKALDSYQRGVQADFTKSLQQIEYEIQQEQKAN